MVSRTPTDASCSSIQHPDPYPPRPPDRLDHTIPVSVEPVQPRRAFPHRSKFRVPSVEQEPRGGVLQKPAEEDQGERNPRDPKEENDESLRDGPAEALGEGEPTDSLEEPTSKEDPPCWAFGAAAVSMLHPSPTASGPK